MNCRVNSTNAGAGAGLGACLSISGFRWPVKGESDSALGMSKTFCPWKIDEPLFLPPTVQDFIGPGHLARFVLSLVREVIDLSKITGTYGSERGQPPFDPIMMTALLLMRIAAASTRRARSPRRAGSGSIS